MESNGDSDGSILGLFLLIGVASCLFISGVSVGVILYHRKRGKTESSVRQRMPSKSRQSSSCRDIELPTPNTNESIPRMSTMTVTHTHYGEGQEGVIETGLVPPINSEEPPGQTINKSTDNMDKSDPGANLNTNDFVVNSGTDGFESEEY